MEQGPFHETYHETCNILWKKYGTFNETQNEELSLEHRTWTLEHGALNMELGRWNLEHGTWNMELGTWNLEHGTWNLENVTFHGTHHGNSKEKFYGT